MASHPLSVAVLGVGRIGSTFAYHLARAGHLVTAIARANSARLAQLTADKAIVLHTGERAAVTPADRLDEQTAYDVVVVCMLDHQLSAVMPSLQRSAAKAVQLMFNTYQPRAAGGGAGRAGALHTRLPARISHYGSRRPTALQHESWQQSAGRQALGGHVHQRRPARHVRAADGVVAPQPRLLLHRSDRHICPRPTKRRGSELDRCHARGTSDAAGPVTHTAVGLSAARPAEGLFLPLAGCRACRGAVVAIPSDGVQRAAGGG